MIQGMEGALSQTDVKKGSAADIFQWFLLSYFTEYYSGKTLIMSLHQWYNMCI